MRRVPWNILLALLVGIGVGLVYAWMISPLKITDATPLSLRSDFRDQYRSAIAAAYSATGNLPRARARLELLQDPDPIQALNAQAQRMLASGAPVQVADQVAALALAIQVEEPEGAIPASDTVTQSVPDMVENSTATLLPLSPESSPAQTETPLATLTPLAEETLPALPESTPRPTSTPVLTASAPFKLTGQDEVCDPNLPDGLMQVIVLNSNRRQMPGVQIDLSWEEGAEQFYTGLKPELGNGYADFIMTPSVSYTVQLAVGSDIASGLTTPVCQTGGGESFGGGIKLTFQRP